MLGRSELRFRGRVVLARGPLAAAVAALVAHPPSAVAAVVAMAVVVVAAAAVTAATAALPHAAGMRIAAFVSQPPHFCLLPTFCCATFTEHSAGNGTFAVSRTH